MAITGLAVKIVELLIMLKPKEDWFVKSRRAIEMAFEDDADLFCRLLAGTSPISTIETNVKMAIRAYQHLKWFGEIPRTGFIEVHYVSIHKLLNDDKSIGRKVWSLYQNLIGNEEVCPIDRWMLRYFGYDGDTRIWKKSFYDELENKIKAEAKELGVTPAQRQVQIWIKQRGDPTSYGDIIVRREITKRNVLARLL